MASLLNKADQRFATLSNLDMQQCPKMFCNFVQKRLAKNNKEQVAEEIQTLEPSKKPEDVIRDPYVLEFLGLKSNDDFYESDLEQALITHLQKFLLELGRGFSFVARQKRITFDGRHFRIDYSDSRFIPILPYAILKS